MEVEGRAAASTDTDDADRHGLSAETLDTGEVVREQHGEDVALTPGEEPARALSH
ncbi:hypothetical protein [Actinotalea subterranea]|uniref:hypothetical protein n=1 Tax=Actinotalea subterranea TaxID=2607497 RepID=UPI00165D84ED|nr:hypothetical protein [Actinotalea subterranea]